MRIRILRGSRVLLDANLSSFAVAGPALELVRHNGAHLARLQVTIQDVLGFIKLVHKFTGAQVVVRGQRGQALSSPPAVPRGTLPAGGCVTVWGSRYVVRSFGETSFSGEPLTVWALIGA